MKQNLSFEEYKDKVYACWLGKNIGGSLGGPFECKRGVWELSDYTADLTKGPLPNDDLDLQLVWLNAAEAYGTSVNSEILGEYWLSYITPHWSEYGTAKNNMANGIQPPYSGMYHNHNKDSCGAFIRSELWACLAPGHPQIAVKYAFEDAICDHADEGLYAEIFCAAVESAAFIENDTGKLIETGLAYIPSDCAIAKVVLAAQECYKNGLNWKEARIKILQDFPCSFGMYSGYEDRTPEPEVPAGRLGFDAPANIGFTIIGWLYGEGDFGKSICIAAGCGEDSDCTAATLGSILGIAGGTSALPEKWTKPLGNKIVTISISSTDTGITIPQTIDLLSERVCRLMPVFIGNDFDFLNTENMSISCPSGLADTPEKLGVYARRNFRQWLSVRSSGIARSNPLLEAVVSVENGIHIEEGSEKQIKIHLYNKQDQPLWLTLRWIMPDDWTASPGRSSQVFLEQYHGGCRITDVSHVLIPQELKNSRYDIILEITANSRLSHLYIPITLFSGRDTIHCESYNL